TPLLMWVKGYLQCDGELGSVVQIKTATGRMESGILEEVEPMVVLDYGQYVSELAQIAEGLWR
ncbi:MAG: 2-amino-4-ketopentanoate thiolase, partial [Defluviitaleaceae bacterium]|nr:2-amino-4-ketopentanoate thiolase [Defluviitaleaceae bacterium]